MQNAMRYVKKLAFHHCSSSVKETRASNNAKSTPASDKVSGKGSSFTKM
jgi:hypothetical protein